MLLISCHIIIHFRCQTYIKTYISIVVQESEWGVGWNPFCVFVKLQYFEKFFTFNR